MSATQISIKLTRPPSGLTRKVAYEARPTWDELAGRIESLYDVPKEHVAVSYIDNEGDEVTMNTQTELHDFYNTQAGSATLRFVVHDMRVPSPRASRREAEEHTSPASQLANNVAEVIASLSEMGGANADFVGRIRDVGRRVAPFWQAGGGPYSVPFGPYPPPPPPPPHMFGHHHRGPWGFPEGYAERSSHHGPSGPPLAHHESPSPPPGPRTSALLPDEAAAPGTFGGIRRAHHHHHHRHGLPHTRGHRHHRSPRSRSSPVAPPGAWSTPSGPPPGTEDYIHVPPHAEAASQSSGTTVHPPPPEDALPRSSDPSDGHDNRGGRHGPGHQGPPTPLDAFFAMGPDLARMFGFNPVHYGWGPGRQWDIGSQGRYRPSPPPHARGTRAFWGPEESSESEPESSAKI